MENFMLQESYWAPLERGKISAGQRECAVCGELHDEEKMIFTRDAEWICEECADGWYYFCNECYEWVHVDDWDEHMKMCKECAKESKEDV